MNLLKTFRTKNMDNGNDIVISAIDNKIFINREFKVRFKSSKKKINEMIENEGLGFNARRWINVIIK